MTVQYIHLNVNQRKDSFHLLPCTDFLYKSKVLFLITGIGCLIKGIHHERGCHPVRLINIGPDDAPALSAKRSQDSIRTEGADGRHQCGTFTCIHVFPFFHRPAIGFDAPLLLEGNAAVPMLFPSRRAMLTF